MRLSAEVALVGGGTHSGFGLSPGPDCHVYLLESRGEAALIDCGLGTPASREAVLAHISESGIRPTAITRLLLTHYHADHSGGAARWRETLGLEVAIGAEGADAVECGDLDATGLTRAKQSGIYDPDYEQLACPVDHRLSDGEQISVGDLTVTYISTPGHCRGHGAFYVTGGEKTYLFTGDCVLHGGRILLQNIPDCDIDEYSRSVGRLNQLEFDCLLPGHGAIALADGRLHVAKAARAFEGVGLPPGRF